MNWALWEKTIREARLLLVASSVLLTGFTWLYVVVMSQFQMPRVLQNLPSWWLEKFFLPMMGLSLDKMITSTGQFSMVYVDIVTVAIAVGWAITRGSDIVSGELGRGTMELLLAQPVSRSQVFLSHVAVSLGGAAVLACCIWGGTSLGVLCLQWNPPTDDPEKWQQLTAQAFFPGAVNFFFLIFALTGVTSCFSAFDSERWRTIGLGAGFFLVSVLLKVISRLWEPGSWLGYLSFMSAYEPQKLIVLAEDATAMAWQQNGALFLLGLVGFIVAYCQFLRRDLPAPL